MSETWKIKLLYDGECPLCVREVNFLLKKDAGRGLVKFVDISDDEYNPEDNGGIDYKTAMGRIHGVLANGKIIKNVAVFRQVYETLGIGWVYALTKIPLIGRIADGIYGLWADYRLKLTNRPPLEILVKEKGKKGQCRIDL
jgi:predicted DCC family thiol-disulfide oxidoreductase YuxK